MQKHKLVQGQKVFFVGEKLPYKVMAISKRYVVVSRGIHRREDAALLHHQVETHAFTSFTEAFDFYKDAPIYSILDFKKNIRAPDDLVFGLFDYFDEQDCKKAIKYLEKDKMGLSYKNSIEIHIDWERTNGI